MREYSGWGRGGVRCEVYGAGCSGVAGYEIWWGDGRVGEVRSKLGGVGCTVVGDKL